jgi:hypothetical protein
MTCRTAAACGEAAPRWGPQPARRREIRTSLTMTEADRDGGGGESASNTGGLRRLAVLDTAGRIRLRGAEGRLRTCRRERDPCSIPRHTPRPREEGDTDCCRRRALPPCQLGRSRRLRHRHPWGNRPGSSSWASGAKLPSFLRTRSIPLDRLQPVTADRSQSVSRQKGGLLCQRKPWHDKKNRYRRRESFATDATFVTKKRWLHDQSASRRISFLPLGLSTLDLATAAGGPSNRSNNK